MQARKSPPAYEAVVEAPAPLIPQLAAYEAQFRAIKAEVGELVDGLTDDQFNWRPDADRWSIAECVVHLNVVGRLLMPGLEEAIEQAHAEQRFSEGPFRYGLLGKWFVHAMEPPPRFKVKTFKLYHPAPDRHLAQVMPEFMGLQDQLIQRLYDANGIDLARVKVSSPVNRLLRFGIGVWFAATAAHERRHLWQARQVGREAAFPKA